MDRQYDDIIIGAGQSGPFLAVRFARAGRRVAVIERATVGGTCVNNGCIPTKTMIASARAAHVARTGARYGVRTGAVSVDYAAVKARKDEIVAGKVDGLVSWMQDAGVTLVSGEARFTAERTVAVNGETLRASRVFINTGARPVVPDWPGIGEVPYLTNVSIMDLDELPEHLVIVGGSYVGLEFAQMFARFGSRVSVLQHGPRLLGREDAEVAEAVRDILAGEGIEIILDAADFSFSRAGSGIDVRVVSGGTARELSASHVLVATGRRPNSDGLGLDAAGIEVDRRGYIVVDEQLQTSAEGVWAMGDVNGHGGFTHTSYNDYEIVAANLLEGGERRRSDRVPAHNLYIDPPLGRVGMSEAEVREKGIGALVGTYPMSRVGRAQEKGKTQGFIKVLVEAESGLILGAAMLGIECDEVVQMLLPLMTARVAYQTIMRTMFIHPTVTELLPSVFGALEPLQ